MENIPVEFMPEGGGSAKQTQIYKANLTSQKYPHGYKRAFIFASRILSEYETEDFSSRKKKKKKKE